MTARSEVSDKIDLLDIGADDYIPKPFEPKELELRISNICLLYTSPSPRDRG